MTNPLAHNPPPPPTPYVIMFSDCGDLDKGAERQRDRVQKAVPVSTQQVPCSLSSLFCAVPVARSETVLPFSGCPGVPCTVCDVPRTMPRKGHKHSFNCV